MVGKFRGKFTRRPRHVRPACRHAFEPRRHGSAVVVLQCVSCDAVTLEFIPNAEWTAADQRIVDRYYIREHL